MNMKVRVIDPILTNVARGYSNAEFVGKTLFPTVPVEAAGGKILEFGKEAFHLYNTRRAPGADAKRVAFGYEGKPFALETHDLDAVVPDEWQRDANVVPGIDLASRAINLTSNVMGLGLEYEQARLATTPLNYDPDHVEVLADADALAAKTNIAAWMDSLKDKVRQQTGKAPNVLVLSPVFYRVLRNHPEVREQFKYSTSQSITVEMLAQFFDVEKVVVGRAVFAEQDSAEFKDVWGKAMVLAYVPATPIGREEPSYGYTYELNGSLTVNQPYRDNPKRSWVYGVHHERAPVIAGKNAGVLVYLQG